MLIRFFFFFSLKHSKINCFLKTIYILLYSVTNELLDKLPKKITDDYAEFDNLRATSSHEFYINAVNSVGKSKNASKIYVPSSSACKRQKLFLFSLFYT